MDAVAFSPNLSTVDSRSQLRPVAPRLACRPALPFMPPAQARLTHRSSCGRPWTSLTRVVTTAALGSDGVDLDVDVDVDVGLDSEDPPDSQEALNAHPLASSAHPAGNNPPHPSPTHGTSTGAVAGTGNSAPAPAPDALNRASPPAAVVPAEGQAADRAAAHEQQRQQLVFKADAEARAVAGSGEAEAAGRLSGSGQAADGVLLASGAAGAGLLSASMSLQGAGRTHDGGASTPWPAAPPDKRGIAATRQRMARYRAADRRRDRDRDRDRARAVAGDGAARAALDVAAAREREGGAEGAGQYQEQLAARGSDEWGDSASANSPHADERESGRERGPRLKRAHSIRRALGIPEPGSGGRRQMVAQGTARVRQTLGQAVRSAQKSTVAEVVAAVFFIVCPLGIGALVYAAVQHAVQGLEPVAPPVAVPTSWWAQLTQAWQHWMRSDQAAGAASAFAGIAGFGIAAKTAMPAAAFVSATVPQMDTLWRSFGGASLVALYWKTLVFGKTFRSVEWDLLNSDAPDGRMHSVTIRVPSLNAVRAKIALANDLDRASHVQQLALWIPSSGEFLEPLRQAKDLSLVPELGFIVWSRVPEWQVPLPPRAHKQPSPASEAEHAAAEQADDSGDNPTKVFSDMDEASISVIRFVADCAEISSEWRRRREDVFEATQTAAASLVEPAHVHDASTTPPFKALSANGAASADANAVGNRQAESMPLERTTSSDFPTSLMVSEEEADILIDLAVRQDKGLLLLYESLGPCERFMRSALYYIRQ